MTMSMELCIVLYRYMFVGCGGCKKPNPRMNSCMNSNIKYGNYEILYGIMCIWTMVGISMVFNPRVLLGFHPNPKIIEGKVGKTLNGTRRMWNPPLWFKFK